MQKPREIDVYATPTKEEFSRGSIGPFSISHRLGVECKRSSTHAWIFITQKVAQLGFQGQCMDFMSFNAESASVCFLDDILSTCKTHLHYSDFQRVSRWHVEIRYEGRGGRDNEIFEAKNQLVKNAAYEIDRLLEKLKEDSQFDPFSYHPIWLYHPAIIFDGKL